MSTRDRRLVGPGSVVAAVAPGVPIASDNQSSNLWRACVCAGSIGALGIVLWLTWPRRPKPTRESVIAGLRRLREECAAVYADITALVTCANLPSHMRGTSMPYGEGDDVNKEHGEKLQHAIEQPLILMAALHDAAARAAREIHPSCTAEDLETDSQRFCDDMEVQRITSEIQEMHTSCLRGNLAGVLKSSTVGGDALWNAASALEMLRKIGQAKVKCLEALVSEARTKETCNKQLATFRPESGLAVVHACAQAENEIWERLWPDDSARRCCFVTAVERFTFSDSLFRKQRIALDKELENLTITTIANSMKLFCRSAG